MGSSSYKRIVHVVIGDDLLSTIKGSRDPDFMSVDQVPTSTFRFRFKIEKQGHDDSTGSDFDWWFRKLIEASEAARESGQSQVVSVVEDVYNTGTYYQNKWSGMLATGVNDSPCRHRDNEILFQFELKVASFTRTFIREEHMPREGRWLERALDDEFQEGWNHPEFSEGVRFDET